MRPGPGIRRLLRLPDGARTADGDVDAEVAFHLDTRIDELVARGVPREEARRQAVAEFGDVADARRELREMETRRRGRARRAHWWDALAQDVRFAARSMRRQPSVPSIAVLTLALGIGANAAIFSVVNAVLLRPLPYADPGSLVSVWPRMPYQLGIYAAVKERTARSFSAFSGYSWSRAVSLTGDGEPARVAAVRTSGDLFQTLGARALLGRTLLPGEDVPGRDRVVVLSHALWRQRFGGDTGIVGRQVTIDGVSRTVVGVMPERFRFPSPDAALWFPAALDASDIGGYWGMSSHFVVARLRPGVSIDAARAEAAAVIDGARSLFPWRMPDEWGTGVTVVPLRDQIVGGTRTTLLVLLGAVGLVLLVACVNVANLLLARAAAREREVAVRAALGAGRGRVVRQLLTESVLLALCGAAAGVLLAHWTLRGLVALLPAGMPRVDEIGIDATVLAATAAAAVATGILFGLAPALRASRDDLQRALASGGRTQAGGRRRLSEGLVVAQIALAVVLVAGAGLLLRSFERLTSEDPGFRTERVVAAEVPLPAFAADTAGGARAFYDAVLARVQAIPGVSAAAVTTQLPFASTRTSSAMEVEAHPTPPGQEPPLPDVVSVSADYLRTMGIPLRAGRALTEADREGTPLVGLVDEEAARLFWPGEDPIGQRIRYVWQLDTWITVVGVVGNVKRDSLSAPAAPSLYRPLRQGLPGPMRLVVRTDLAAGALAPSLRAAVAAVNPNVPVADIRALEDIVAGSAARPRFTALLIAGFALLALALGAVGIYGVIAYAVARRTREIGVRMALGAASGDVRRMVLREGGTLAAAGLALGLAGALAAGRLLAGLLYGVAPHDPPVLLGVATLLGVVALLASVLPARRAARVDPLVAMRAE